MCFHIFTPRRSDPFSPASFPARTGNPALPRFLMRESGNSQNTSANPTLFAVEWSFR
jgi:hypothetical protein